MNPPTLWVIRRVEPPDLAYSLIPNREITLSQPSPRGQAHRPRSPPRNGHPPFAKLKNAYKTSVKSTTSHFDNFTQSKPMFKHAYKTCVKSTNSMCCVCLCALACCHASVFAAQGPSESDVGISSTLPQFQTVKANVQ